MLKLTARWETKVFLGVFMVGLAFAAFTQHAWEDFFIVLRQAQNLATGHGLVYTPGERVQSFTSPLGILIPAAISWATGATTYEPVLWGFRLISLIALGLAAGLFYQILRRFQRHIFATVFTMLLIMLDAKTVDFTISGMETGLFIFFLALAAHGLLLGGPRRLWRIGLGFAGLMWTRPDGCIYIAALGLGAFFFLPGRASEEPRGKWFRQLLLACAICALLYLPWFLWAWWYYGSPIPNSIVAKGANMAPINGFGLLQEAIFFPFLSLADSIPLRLFIPAYAGPDWSSLMVGTSAGLAWITAVAWLCPLVRPQARVLSFAVYVGELYLSQVVRKVFPWYLPIVSVMGYLTLGLLVDQIFRLARRLPEMGLAGGWLRHLSGLTRTVCGLLVLGQLTVFLCVARQMQVEQRLVEDGVRRTVGLWLKEHAHSPNDTVMLEPLGYVGYFSQLRMLDYPGLASKKVVEVRKRLGPGKEREAWLELKPDWIVLRPYELRGESYINTTRLSEFYDMLAEVDQDEALKAIPWVPGRGMVAFDDKFYIFHRKDAVSTGTPK